MGVIRNSDTEFEMRASARLGSATFRLHTIDEIVTISRSFLLVR